MSKLYISTKFGQAPHHLLNDESLSLKAKGLFTYIQSKPDGWEFSIDRIKKQTKEGKQAIQAAVWELENAGYLIRKPSKDERGRWAGYDYYLFLEPQNIEEPINKNPSTKNKSTENELMENPITFSKKEYSKKEVVKKNKNMQDKSCEETGKKINEFIGMFRDINPTINFQNKTERKKLKELLEIYEEETVEYMIQAAIQSHGEQYAPVITKPTELYKKLSNLRAFLSRKNQEKEKNSTLVLEEIK